MPTSELTNAAAMAGAVDLFVLSEVSPGQLVHIDGAGRGSGWAGNVEVAADREPHLQAGMTGLHRVSAPNAVRIFGPYWNTEAAVLCAGDYTMVFGGAGLHDDDKLHQAASEAAWSAGDVPSSKRLADELELAQAVLSVAKVDRSSVRRAAEGLATSAANALGCEFSAVLLRGEHAGVYLGATAWRPQASDEDIAAAIERIPLGDLDEVCVEDDLMASPWAQHPLGLESGLVTRCAVKIRAGDTFGALVIAHHGNVPRGFTSLCRRVASGVAEAGSELLTDVVSR